MISYVYNDANYHDWLNGFSEAAGLPKPDNSFLSIPPGLGKGYLKAFVLPNSLNVLISDFTLNQHLSLHRESSPLPGTYTLRFDEINVTDSLNVRIENEKLMQQGHQRAAVTLTCDKFDVELFISRHSAIKSVNILFPEEWLGKYLDVEASEWVLSRYISLKTASVNFEPYDSRYRQLLDELFEVSQEDPLWLARMENRVMLLVERFFTRLFEKTGDQHPRPGISQQDITMLMEVEAALLNSIEGVPPTIPELSRLASMSQSKLKKQFKDVYGMPMYRYFQKHRMQEARKLLLSGRFSVKEVGMKLGYSNLSHFAMAFKKEFDLLPSEVMLLN